LVSLALAWALHIPATTCGLTALRVRHTSVCAAFLLWTDDRLLFSFHKTVFDCEQIWVLTPLVSTMKHKVRNCGFWFRISYQIHDWKYISATVDVSCGVCWASYRSSYLVGTGRYMLSGTAGWEEASWRPCCAGSGWQRRWTVGSTKCPSEGVSEGLFSRPPSLPLPHVWSGQCCHVSFESQMLIVLRFFGNFNWTSIVIYFWLCIVISLGVGQSAIKVKGSVVGCTIDRCMLLGTCIKSVSKTCYASYIAECSS